MDKTVKIQKEVPVLYDVDVLVVGCGVAGTIAAVAAARGGANTAVIDRFGQIGGNIGPGHIGGAPSLELPPEMADGVPGIAGELLAEVESLTGHQFLLSYFDDSQTFSNVALRMFRKENITMLFNVYMGDAIMDGDTIKGVFVETKAGTKAILAKVVIDTTGDADVAFRAGAPVDSGPDHYFHSGMYYSIGNVDIAAYKAVGEAPVSEELLKWKDEMGNPCNHHAYPLLPYMKKAHEEGDFEYVWKGRYGTICADHGVFFCTTGVAEPGIVDPRHLEKYGIVGGLTGLHHSGKTESSGDPELMTELENDCREYIYALHRFMKKYVPGFEKSYLHSIGIYYNARGGRSMLARHNICEEDLRNEVEFDDMVFRGFARHQPQHPLWVVVHHYKFSFDMPYRQFLPQNVEGLLAAGRACNNQGGKADDPKRGAVLRMRWQMFLTGETVGTAAAMAAKANVPPSQVDVPALRKKLHAQGFYMGKTERLAELGLS